MSTQCLSKFLFISNNFSLVHHLLTPMGHKRALEHQLENTVLILSYNHTLIPFNEILVSPVYYSHHSTENITGTQQIFANLNLEGLVRGMGRLKPQQTRYPMCQWSNWPKSIPKEPRKCFQVCLGCQGRPDWLQPSVSAFGSWGTVCRTRWPLTQQDQLQNWQNEHADPLPKSY